MLTALAFVEGMYRVDFRLITDVDIVAWRMTNVKRNWDRICANRYIAFLQFEGFAYNKGAPAL